MTRRKFGQRAAALLLICFVLCVEVMAAPTYLIPGGSTVGIKLYTEGLLVTAVEKNSPAAAAGIRKGDTILYVNGHNKIDGDALRQEVQRGNGIVLTVSRGDGQAEFFLNPQQTADGWKLGLYLRDNVAGIGTVTYYDPLTGNYGALGHGVTDPGGTSLLRIRGGVLVPSSVAEVQKGKSGAPGQLRGQFDVTQIFGCVRDNHDCGIFGYFDHAPGGEAMKVAAADEVHTGAAEIYANVSGTAVCAYTVEIERIDPDASGGRNYFLRVTDEDLLRQTGGIVQGMSGSPIVQDGKLVGAVTHVLVNDPTAGYGLFIGTMLAAEEKAAGD